MEESAPNNLPPPEDILTPRDTLEQATVVNVTPNTGTSLETQAASGVNQSALPVQVASATEPDSEHRFANLMQNKLLRRVALASVILLVFIGLLVAATFIFERTHKVGLSQAERIAQIKDQAVRLDNTTTSVGPGSLRAGVATLFVNGDVSVNGVLRLSDNSHYGQFNLGAGLTSDQSYTLPNASGSLCLDSNNCQFATAAQLAATAAQLAALTRNSGVASLLTGGTGISITNNAVNNDGVLSLNGATGATNLQGTANQVNVNTVGRTLTLSLPQDVATTSTPTFEGLTLNGLTLNAVGSQNGNALCDISNNCGFASGTNTILQNGNSFGTDVVIGAIDGFGVSLKASGNIVATIGASGATLLKNTTNSSAAFQVQNASAVNLFQIDTFNNRVYVGNSTADSTGTLLVLDSKNTVGDPTGVNGGLYYNSNSNKLRCFQNSSWQDCIGGGGVGTGDINQGGNDFGTAIRIGDTGGHDLNLLTSNTTRLTVLANGNVGIGNTNPGGLFRVGNVNTADPTSIAMITNTGSVNNRILALQGVAGQFAAYLTIQASSGGTPLSSIDLLGNFRAPAGTTTSPGLSFQAESTLGFYRPATGVLAVTVNAEVARWTAQGLEVGSTGTQGAAEKFRVNTPDTVSATAATILATGGSGNKGVVVQGTVGQTANLQEWQTAAGSATGILASIGATGSTLFRNSANTATAFRVQNAGLVDLFKVDTLNNVIYAGNSTADTTGTLLVVDSKTSAGDPTGINGGIYYNTSTNKFRCFENSVWANCVNPPGSGTGDVNNNGNSFGSTMSLGTIDDNGLNLITHGNTVMQLSNTGQATFKNFSDSPTAFQIQNATNVSLFTVDSANSRVYVGSPTADSTGTLLVLDTKNTAGDPTGINGAMYYNSSLGKFRCFEAGAWANCLYTIQTATKTADQTFASTSYADVNDLSFSVLANKAYRLSCSLLVSVPSGTNGGNLSTNGPAATQYTATFAKSLDQSSGDNYATSSSYDDTSAATTFKVNTISTGASRFIVNYNALLVNGASSGTWSLRSKAFDGSSSLTMYANSSCDMKPL